MWDLPGPGMEPASPALAGGLFTTETPGEPRSVLLEEGRSKVSGTWGQKSAACHLQRGCAGPTPRTRLGSLCHSTETSQGDPATCLSSEPQGATRFAPRSGLHAHRKGLPLCLCPRKCACFTTRPISGPANCQIIHFPLGFLSRPIALPQFQNLLQGFFLKSQPAPILFAHVVKHCFHQFTIFRSFVLLFLNIILVQEVI